MKVISVLLVMLAFLLSHHACQSSYPQGGRIYSTLCASCHMKDGSGLEKLYPPLNGSNYLATASVDTLVCRILKGHPGGIVADGVLYNEQMPAYPDLKPAEMTNLLNYISNNWGNAFRTFHPQDVEKAHKHCSD